MEEQIYDTIRTVTQIVLMLCGLKAISGFHFPWEKCECCGKRYRDHDWEIKEVT